MLWVFLGNTAEHNVRSSIILCLCMIDTVSATVHVHRLHSFKSGTCDFTACVCMCACMHACLPACLPVCLSVCLSVCLLNLMD